MPSTSASAVAPIAAWSEVRSAWRMPLSLNALTYQSIVRSVIGHFTSGLALNEYRTMIAIGM